MLDIHIDEKKESEESDLPKPRQLDMYQSVPTLLSINRLPSSPSKKNKTPLELKNVGETDNIPKESQEFTSKIPIEQDITSKPESQPNN